MKQLKYQEEISIPQAKAFVPQGASCNDEIFLIEDLTTKDLPTCRKQVKCLVIILCLEGKLRYEIDGHTVIAEKNDAILLAQGQQTNDYQVLSATFKAKAILIKSDRLFFSLAQSKGSIIYLKRELTNTDIIKLNRQEMTNSCIWFSQIANFLTTEKYTDNFALASTLTTLFLQMALSKKQQMAETKKVTPTQELYYRFINLVDKHVMQRLPLSNYCEKLKISSSTLEGIIRKYEGCTPIKYIHMRLINRICIMAECTSPKKMPIKKIAEYTHFKNAAALSRFVRIQLNMTLTTYRKLESETQLSLIHRTILDQNAVLAVLPKTYIQEDSILLLS